MSPRSTHTPQRLRWRIAGPLLSGSDVCLTKQTNEVAHPKFLLLGIPEGQAYGTQAGVDAAESDPSTTGIATRCGHDMSAHESKAYLLWEPVVVGEV